MTKRARLLKNLDNREIIDRNARLIDALKNFNTRLCCNDGRTAAVSMPIEEDKKSDRLKDMTQNF